MVLLYANCMHEHITKANFCTFKGQKSLEIAQMSHFKVILEIITPKMAVGRNIEEKKS